MMKDFSEMNLSLVSVDEFSTAGLYCALAILRVGSMKIAEDGLE
jgi:hypothetical protein